LFVVIAAAGPCSLEECNSNDCKQSSESSSTFDLPKSAGTPQFFQRDCSTCGHPTVKAEWDFTSGPSGGNVRILVYGECKNGPGGGSPNIKEGPAVQGSIEIEPANLKNICGDPADVKWNVEFLNQSDAVLHNFHITIACSTFTGEAGGAAPPLAPSGIRKG
jgi:hypothetical protein